MSKNNNKTALTTNDTNKGLNPIVAIGVAIVIAMVLAGTSLQIFLSSDAREIINIKEESISTTEADLSETPPKDGDLTSSELNSIETGIKNTANSVDSDDFSSTEMTDAALGL